MRTSTGARSVTAVRSLSRLIAGSKIGPWRIIERDRLAHHRTSYVVTHVDSERSASLDLYDAPPRPFGSYAGQLRALMHKLNRIGHHAVMTILDVGAIEDGRPYVVRERIDGTTLAASVAATPWSSAEVVELLLAICDGVAAAHTLGVVHRALDLDHVVLLTARRSGTLAIKLVDWGITAEMMEASRPGTNAVRRRFTAADDVYSLGVLMHSLLVRVPPQLESLWLAMLAEEPAARPFIAEVAKRLHAVQGDDLERPMFVVEEPVRVVPVVPAPTVIAEPPKPPPALAAASSSGRVALASAAAMLAVFATYVVVDRTRPVPVQASIVDRAPPRIAIQAPSSQPASTTIVMREAPADATSPQPDAPHAPAAMNVSSPRIAPRAPAPAAPPVQETVQEAARPPIHEAEPTQGVMRAQARERSPRVERPLKLPITPVLAVARAPISTVAAPPPASTDDRPAIMASYQRVGRKLLDLERQFGPAAASEVSSRFKWIKLDAALATATSRRILTATLSTLQGKLDRALATACARAPDVAICRPR